MRNPFSRKQPEPDPVPLPVVPVALTDDQVATLREVARGLVVPGFRSRADVRVAVVDHLVDDVHDTDLLEREGARIADEAWAAREAELAAGGEGSGDYGRLAIAFDALNSDGILARMDFACCQNCGTTEIDDERTPLADAAPGTYPWAEWAYTFFHAQDAERLAEPDPTLYLSFSSFRAAPDADPNDIAAGRAGDQEAMKRVIAHTDATVGRAVVTALVEAGLTVSWDGTAAQRIAVQVPDWRKPLPTS